MLGRKTLAARAGVTERTVRRWADGTRTPSKAQQKRINRLYRDFRPEVEAVSKRTQGVRETVDKRTGEIVRRVGRRRLPDLPLDTVMDDAGKLRGVDPDLAKLGSAALLDKLEADGVTDYQIVYVENEDEPGVLIPFFIPRFPSVSNGVVAYFLVQEYRRGAREMFSDRTLIPPASPSFFEPADRAGLERAGPSGERRIEDPAQGRRFGTELVRDIREAYTRIGDDDIIISPSALVSRGSLQGLAENS